MKHLRLVVDNEVAPKIPTELDRILIEKDWSEYEREIIQQLDEYSQFFLARQNIGSTYDSNEDYSKHFIIFSYNYFELGLIEKAREMLTHVDPRYFTQTMIHDVEKAVDHRNKAIEFERKRQWQMANEHKKEAEYFLVVVQIIPYLEKEESICRYAPYLEFMRQLEESVFTLNLTRPLHIVTD